MSLPRFFAVLICFSTATLGIQAVAQERTRVDPVWYVPNPGTLDLRAMFERPDEWRRARQHISVFQFTEQHTYQQPTPNVGPNSFDALAAAGAFRRLRAWRIKTAVGVGPVKEFNCRADEELEGAIAGSLEVIRRVQGAGGAVDYLAMDEPFLSGSLPRCGLMPVRTADRIALYVSRLREAQPRTRVGLIEAYPSFSAADFERMLALLAERQAAPAFLHVDIDLLAVRPGRHDLAGDLKRIQRACAAARVPFGVIIWGYNGDANALFTADASRLADRLREVFPTREEMPDQWIFESWSQSRTGLNITPSNLPDDERYTLTNTLVQMLRRFYGGSGPSTGTAVRR